jgi:hypothetical protein
VTLSRPLSGGGRIVQARSSSGGITIVTAVVGVLALAACGGAGTAPTAVGPSSGSIVTHDNSHGGSIEGTVMSIVSGTSCPMLSFMVGTTKVSVTMATRFEGGSCASIVVRARVEVEGTRQADNSILASEIEIEENEAEEREVEGVITSLKAGTACPTLTFFIGSNQVDVTAATVFVNGTCADIAVGKKVGVKGTVTSDHMMLATKIVFKNHDDD